MRYGWQLGGADPRTHAHKKATYCAWMASPLKPSTAWDPPHLLPRYLQLELSRHVLRNIARFCLRAHTLRVETGCWQIHNRLCDKCDLQMSRIKHVSFYALALEMCYLRGNLQDNLLILLGILQSDLLILLRADRIYIVDTGAFDFDNISAEDVNCFS